jgi:hypothetical protein
VHKKISYTNIYILLFIHKKLLLGFKTATGSETPVHLLHIQEAEQHGIDILFYRRTEILRRGKRTLVKITRFV